MEKIYWVHKIPNFILDFKNQIAHPMQITLIDVFPQNINGRKGPFAKEAHLLRLIHKGFLELFLLLAERHRAGAVLVFCKQTNILLSAIIYPSFFCNFYIGVFNSKRRKFTLAFLISNLRHHFLSKKKNQI